MADSRRLAKLTRPRSHEAVARHRLFALLDEARAATVAWVAGPPGAGKTTLVSTYIESRGMRSVWYQVDAGDGDPASFFLHLRLAISRRTDAARIPAFAPEHCTDLSGFSRLFFRRFFATLPGGTRLVLDNFQEAADTVLAPILHDACAEVPQDIGLIVVSRERPGSRFTDLELRGNLRLIDWSDLRLTLDETRRISALRGIFDERSTDELFRRTDGWAAGVTLLLSQVDRADDTPPVLTSETREKVFDYFASFMLGRTSPRVRQRLLELAFVPRITPDVAEHIADGPEVGRLLERLWRQQMFIDRRPGIEPVYELHALFREFLRARARSAWSAAQFDGQLRKSAEALEAHGDFESALMLFAEAKSWEQAASIVLAHGEKLLATGRSRTLTQWIEMFPESVRQSNLRLTYWLARSQAQTAPLLGARLFDRAQAGFAENGDRAGRIQALAGLLYACAVDHGDFPTIARTLDELANELTVSPPSLTTAEQLDAWSALLTAGFHWAPWHPCLAPGLDRIEHLLRDAPKCAASVKAAASALLVASRSGDVERANRIAVLVERLAGDEHGSALERTWALFQLAHQRFVMADYDASLRWFERTWALADENGLKAVLTAVLTYRFMADFRLKERAAVDESMRRIRELPAPVHRYSRALLTCYEARYAQLQGDRERAADLALQVHADIAALGAGFHEICYGLILGEILLDASRTALARPLIDRTRQLVERSVLLWNFRASVMLVEAWLAEQEGRMDDSLRLLGDALRTSENGFAWCQMRFIDTTCAHMLRVALRRHVEPRTARRLVRTFRLRPQETDSAWWPWPCRIRVLGRFEIERDDSTVRYGRKAPRKLLALLEILVLHGPQEVSEDLIIDALWPDEDGDAAHRALGISVLRLRRLLGDNEVIRQGGGKLVIDRQRCWVDAWEFERVINRFRFSAPDDASSEWNDLEKALALYEGPLLPQDDLYAGTMVARERLRSRYSQGLSALCDHLERCGLGDKAMDWQRRLLETTPDTAAGQQRHHHAEPVGKP